MNLVLIINRKEFSLIKHLWLLWNKALDDFTVISRNIERIGRFSISKRLEFVERLVSSSFVKPRWSSFALKPYFHENDIDLCFLNNVFYEISEEKRKKAHCRNNISRSIVDQY